MRIEPQWLFDGISRIIRNFGIHKVDKVDNFTERKYDDKFKALKTDGRFGRVLVADHLVVAS